LDLFLLPIDDKTMTSAALLWLPPCHNASCGTGLILEQRNDDSSSFLLVGGRHAPPASAAVSSGECVFDRAENDFDDKTDGGCRPIRRQWLEARGFQEGRACVSFRRQLTNKKKATATRQKRQRPRESAPAATPPGAAITG